MFRLAAVDDYDDGFMPPRCVTEFPGSLVFFNVFTGVVVWLDHHRVALGDARPWRHQLTMAHGARARLSSRGRHQVDVLKD